MSREEAQSVIMTEQKCVNRANCNRDCANCDLVMDDTVINEALSMAIKALEQPEIKCIAKVTLTDEQVKEAFEKAKCEILAVMDVQRWIPCSERLPEDYTDVLAWFEYFRHGNYNCLYQTYGIGSYSMEYDSWMINHETGWHKLRVIAWMPLPEPYEKEDGEKK